MKGSLAVYLDNASSTMPDLLSGKLNNSGLPSGNGFYSIEPSVGISWLYNGWNLSADLHYNIPISSDTDHSINYSYWSADEFMSDYTIAKTINKWTVGLGAHWEQQLGSDRLNGAIIPNSRAVNAGLGPLVQYQFSDLSVFAEYSRDTYVRNNVGGNVFNIRFVVPL